MSMLLVLIGTQCSMDSYIGTPPYCQGTKRVDNINHALIIEG